MNRVLLPLLALAASLQAQATPEAAAIIAKARAAVAKDATYLDRAKNLHFEGKVTDKDGASLQSFILEVAEGGKRREFRYDKDFAAELTLVTDGREAWGRQANLQTGERTAARVLPFEVAANLRDMALTDLSFYGVPAGFRAAAKPASKVEGKDVVTVAYTSGPSYTLVRHFDAKTHELVATDYLRPDSSFERQVETETQVVEGIRFPKKVKVLDPKGEFQGTISFEKVVVNGDVPASSFDFPVR